MKKIRLFLIALFVVLLTPSFISVHAGTYEQESLVIDEVQTENIYSLNDTLEVNNILEQDLLSVAGDVVLNDEVRGNVYIAAGDVVINQNISGDVMIAAGNVIINGNIDGDVRVAAGNVYVSSDMIKGDLVVLAGKVQVSKDTEVMGLFSLTGSSVTSNAIEVPTSLDEIPSRDRMMFFGGLDTAAGKDLAESVAPIVAGVLLLVFVVSMLVFLGEILTGYFVLRLFPTYTEKTLVTMKEQPVKAAIVGFGILLFSIPVAIVLLISVVGWPLLFLLAILAGLSLLLAQIFAAYMIGRFFMLRVFGNDTTGRFIPFVVGSLLIALLGIIPFIGGLLSSLLSLFINSWGIGAMVLNKYDSLNAKSKK